MLKRPKILVVGSFVMDLIVSTKRFPQAGETVIGCGFSTAPGGKGANQAIQASRLGADVFMVGKVGNDNYGKELLKSAEESGVNIELTTQTSEYPSAIGNVQIEVGERSTQNRIVVVPGANMQIVREDVAVLKKMIADFDMVILQNEIPMEINIIIAEFAEEFGVPVMFNPAPSGKIPHELFSRLTYISPNEHEAYDITGIALSDKENILKAIEKISNMGVPGVIITLGKNGAVYSKNQEIYFSSCVDCGPCVDPTAAGDSFIGAFCTATAAGIPAQNALEFANCTAGITVSHMGAQTSLPTLDEVLDIMQKKKYNTDCFSILKRVD